MAATLSAWAVRAYARPDVEALCLELQNAHGQCVPLLLWAAWAEGATNPTLAAAAILCRDWETSVIVPLRGVRRALKTSDSRVDDTARERLRSDVKGAELIAELLLLDSLQALTPPASPTPSDSTFERLMAAALAYTAAGAPEPLLVELATRLSGGPVESPPVLL